MELTDIDISDVLKKVRQDDPELAGKLTGLYIKSKSQILSHKQTSEIAILMNYLHDYISV